MAKTGMMIEYRCHTVLDRINVCCICRKLCLLQSQMAVNIPPHSIQDIQKSLWIISLDTQASRKCTVDVFMCVNESGHNDSAVRIHKFSIRISFLDLISYPHHFNGVTIHCHCSILNKSIGCVPCNHSSVSNN